MSSQVAKPKIYKRPPVIEAVIDVRFANPLNPQQLDRLVSKQKSNFTIQPIEEVEVKLSPNEKAGMKAETKMKAETNMISVGYKLINNADSSIIIQVKPDAISFSRLPPYKGWFNLVAEFKKHYAWFTDKKFKRLSRIGVRYINRIDIPRVDGKIELEGYIKIYPNTPKRNFPDFSQFSLQTASIMDGSRMLIVNVHPAIEQPLLNYGSIIFDLDVAQSIKLPEDNSQLYAALDEIREKKNFFFESLLTAKCKRLFN